METPQTTQPVVNAADSISPLNISTREKEALELARINANAINNGSREVLIGLFIVIATAAMCGTVYRIPSLQIFRSYFSIIILCLFIILQRVQQRKMRKEFPDISGKTIDSALEHGPLVFAIIPILLSIMLINLHMDKLSIVIPAATSKMIAMILATGFFTGIAWFFFASYKNWRWMIWGTLSLAISILLGFNVINLSNFYLVLLPFGVIVLLTGLVVNLRHSKR